MIGRLGMTGASLTRGDSAIYKAMSVNTKVALATGGVLTAGAAGGALGLKRGIRYGEKAGIENSADKDPDMQAYVRSVLARKKPVSKTMFAKPSAKLPGGDWRPITQASAKGRATIRARTLRQREARLADKPKPQAAGRRIHEGIKTSKGRLVQGLAHKFPTDPSRPGQVTHAQAFMNGRGGGLVKYNQDVPHSAFVESHEKQHLLPKRNPVTTMNRLKASQRANGREEGRADFLSKRPASMGEYPGTPKFKRGYQDVQRKMAVSEGMKTKRKPIPMTAELKKSDHQKRNVAIGTGAGLAAAHAIPAATDATVHEVLRQYVSGESRAPKENPAAYRRAAGRRIWSGIGHRYTPKGATDMLRRSHGPKTLAPYAGLAIAGGLGGNAIARRGKSKMAKADITMSDADAKKLADKYDTRGPLPKTLSREDKMKAYEARYVASGGKKAEKWKRHAAGAEVARTAGLGAATVSAAGLLATKGKHSAKVMAKVPHLNRHSLEVAGLAGAAGGGSAEMYGAYARHRRASYANSPAGVAGSALTRMQNYTKPKAGAKT